MNQSLFYGQMTHSSVLYPYQIEINWRSSSGEITATWSRISQTFSVGILHFQKRPKHVISPRNNPNHGLKLIYTGLLKMGTRMCNEFQRKSLFFEQGLFGENRKVPIFK